jgi:plasmid stabilization system protein ParE
VTRRLIIRPQAEADIEDIFGWYEARRPGLGAAFVEAVDACLAGIEQQPEMHPELYRRARRALLRRFPYTVFYVIQDESIEVVACFHTRRDPRRWKARVDED